jgi:hypothetical protein
LPNCYLSGTILSIEISGRSVTLAAAPFYRKKSSSKLHNLCAI